MKMFGKYAKLWKILFFLLFYLTTNLAEELNTAQKENCSKIVDAYIELTYDPLYFLYDEINYIEDDQKIDVCGYAIFFDEFVDRCNKTCSYGVEFMKLQNDGGENCKNVEVEKSVIPCLTFGYYYYILCDKKFGYITDIIKKDKNFFYSKRALCCHKDEYIQCKMNKVDLICQNTAYMRNYAKNLKTTYETIKDSVCNDIKCPEKKPLLPLEETKNVASVNGSCICIFIYLYIIVRLHNYIFWSFTKEVSQKKAELGKYGMKTSSDQQDLPAGIEGLSSKSSKPNLTPVYLEEQADGSFKIQGVKANGEKETKQSGAEVESILDRIRSGEIKLPPSVQRLTLPNDEVVEIKDGNIIKTTIAPIATTAASTAATTARPQRHYSTAAVHQQHHHHNQHHRHNYASSSTPITPLINRVSTTRYQDSQRTTTTTTTAAYTATPPTVNKIDTDTTSTYLPTAATERLTDTAHEGSQYAEALVDANKEITTTTTDGHVNYTNPTEDLIQILKTNGLFAMAKYLKQSGLDTILNETGPYTIFVPTDKAFKNLLVQLGGPERAEEKFKSNPRLLSGLLLHHVIPGAFEIASLQDEMTGVSLAGTQLRVNQYTMHDQEWNDVVVTTINGAMVVPNKEDIQIPQGIAHGVDRVMFPLPVGDLLQTLQSDRENRFTNFLKVLYTSGLSEKLQSKDSVKTYTVFAPIDKSFNEMESDVLEKLYNDKQTAEEFAMKHIVSGSLFSAGMRFYQVKDSLQTGKTVVLQKTSAGKIKVNDAQMVTSNIPATNGVIHALDGVLA